jgi:hypothetical protein
MPKPHKAFDYATTAVIAVLAVAVSPVTIRLVTGRADLGLRANIVSIALVTFLLIILCALLTRGRVQRLFFYLVIWTFPFAMLASLEGAAIAFRLADRVAVRGGPVGHQAPGCLDDYRYAVGDTFERL